LIAESEKISSEKLDNENLDTQMINIKFLGELFICGFIEAQILLFIIKDLQNRALDSKGNNDIIDLEGKIKLVIALIETITNKEVLIKNQSDILNILDEIDLNLGSEIDPEILKQLRDMRDLLNQNLEAPVERDKSVDYDSMDSYENYINEETRGFNPEHYYNDYEEDQHHSSYYNQQQQQYYNEYDNQGKYYDEYNQ